MQTFKDTLFREQGLEVDGKSFTDCVFEEITLIYTGGELPTFENCEFMDVNLQFEDAAADTLKFLNSLYGKGFSGAVDKIFANMRKGGA